jgi:hypothetical protein
MRKGIIAMATVAAGAALSSSSVPAQTYLYCDTYVRCVNTTERAYNACFSLALARGWNTSRGEPQGRTTFIVNCLRGRQR